MILIRVLCISFFLVLISLSNTHASDIDVVLDLSDESFSKNETYKLSGKWRFYWKSLIDDFKDLSEENYLTVDVPSAWNTYEIDNETLPRFGYGTYMVRILLPDDRPSSLALKTRRIKMASKVIVNGELVATQGIVSKHGEQTTRGHRPNITLLHLPDDVNVLDLIVQVSNFNYSRGGLSGAIKIGSVDAILKERESGLTQAFLFFGALFITSLYHFVIWMRRREDYSALFFSVFCMLIASRQTLTGEKYLLNVFPNLSDGSMLIMEFSSIFWALPILHIFVSSLFSEEFWKPLKWVSLFILVYEVFKTFFLPLYWFSILVVPTEFYILLTLCHIIYVGAKALMNRKVGALTFSFGIMLFTLFGINDILHERGYVNTAFLSTWGALFFVFAQASVLAFRFSNEFKELGNLKINLESKVTLRTRELQEANNLAHKLTKENRRLINHTVDMLEEERELIAREMHDSLGSAFVTIRVHLEVIEKISKNEDILEITKNLRYIVTENYELARNIVRRIRPEILKTEGLCGAITELVRNQNVTNNILFTNLNCGDISAIPESTALGVYRITQEAITNIVKHSKATKANINLDVRGFIELAITDDGIGFDMKAYSEGVGLISIRERIYSFGGAININSSEGCGTEIIIRIPLLFIEP